MDRREFLVATAAVAAGGKSLAGSTEQSSAGSAVRAKQAILVQFIGSIVFLPSIDAEGRPISHAALVKGHAGYLVLHKDNVDGGSEPPKSAFEAWALPGTQRGDHANYRVWKLQRPFGLEFSGDALEFRNHVTRVVPMASLAGGYAPKWQAQAPVFTTLRAGKLTDGPPRPSRYDHGSAEWEFTTEAGEPLDPLVRVMTDVVNWKARGSGLTIEVDGSALTLKNPNDVRAWVINVSGDSKDPNIAGHIEAYYDLCQSPPAIDKRRIARRAAQVKEVVQALDVEPVFCPPGSFAL